MYSKAVFLRVVKSGLCGKELKGIQNNPDF